MGHNSFIKGSITHVSLGFSRYLWEQHSTAATFGLGGGGIGCTCEGTEDTARCRARDGGVLGGIIQLLSVLGYTRNDPWK